MEICDRLNELIEAQHMSVAAFAKFIGVGDQTVRGVVVQRRNKPGYDFLYKVATAFDWLNVDWLITGRGDMKCEQRLKWGGVDSNDATSPDRELLLAMIREKDRRIEQLIAENALLKAGVN